MEPEGTVEIKFRSRELIKAMRRLDPEVKSLAEKLGDPSLDAKKKNDLETQLLAREQALLPIYTQVSKKDMIWSWQVGRWVGRRAIGRLSDWMVGLYDL